jgi:hypothetical protein
MAVRVVVNKRRVLGLFKYPEGHANVQVQGAQKANREAYKDTRDL